MRNAHDKGKGRCAVRARVFRLRLRGPERVGPRSRERRVLWQPRDLARRSGAKLRAGGAGQDVV